MLLLCIPPILTLLLSNSYAAAALFNGFVQFMVFIPTAMIPGLVTGRLSYVDIAWPWGLISIGLLPILSGIQNTGGIRAKLVMAAYLVAGGRMAFGGAVLFFKGMLKNEFPRYLYLKQKWAKKGITEESNKLQYNLNIQIDILVQCLANQGGLCTPMMLQAFGYKTGDLTTLEIIGWVMWLASITFEHVADKQKKGFIKDCAEKKIKNTVCDVGLWRYSRHPNYFGEWMVWNSLVIASIPSLIAMWESADESIFIKIGMSWGLISISRMMYKCLVHYTGAVPAEFYSVQKRPTYVQYQKTVNMFFPGPRKEAQA